MASGVTYELEINFPGGVAPIVGAGQTVTIVKSVNTVAGNVAWVVFSPFDSNTVTWEETYSIYASNTQVEDGATINQISATSAADTQMGLLYTFNENDFNSGVPGGPATSFNAMNNNGGTFTFGLAQTAEVNGAATQSQLNAVEYLVGDQGSFTPEVTVSIYLSSYANNGVVISSVASSALVVTLTSANPTQALYYSSTTGTFILGTPQLTMQADMRPRRAA